MDRLQQRIIEIALQLPGYLGYEAKERRRDMDKHTRMQLAAKYDAENTHLARIARTAPMQFSTSLENLDQKLERLLARFQTAPRGYAGWFDSAQIVEEDLDALTRFDAALVGGVAQLKGAIDNIGGALKAKEGIDDTISAAAVLLDTLNTEFDQRENLLATGKKPTLDMSADTGSPLAALDAQPRPDPSFQALTDLGISDAVSFDDTDFIISGKIAYNDAGKKFWSFALRDRSIVKWLRVGPGDQVAMCTEIKFPVASPPPDSVEYQGKKLMQDQSGTANVTVDGAGGTRRGSVEYSIYLLNDSRLWIEKFGPDTRSMFGQTVDASDLKVYKK